MGTDSSGVLKSLKLQSGYRFQRRWTGMLPRNSPDGAPRPPASSQTAASGVPELLPTLAEMGFSVYPCLTAVLTVLWSLRARLMGP
ncbi:hypothetical protein Q8A67_009701 [Cirrhinus molitorella]|uniref:Uncharacterized protein n=1 Tax=Cirrhinus molitorella TaxID=172907 RepID=A0AA88PRI9_9TELE|nr:hypothetical protein Q8A67_009701 [Cirrhinus molitorella]